MYTFSSLLLKISIEFYFYRKKTSARFDVDRINKEEMSADLFQFSCNSRSRTQRRKNEKILFHHLNKISKLPHHDYTAKWGGEVKSEPTINSLMET